MTPTLQLYMAIHSKDSEQSLSILAAHPEILSDRFCGETWLHYAAAHGNEALTAKLIEVGAEVDAHLDDLPFTPLDRAVRAGHMACVQMLLNAGAVPRETTPEGGGTLIAAIHGGSIEIVRLLLDRGLNPHTIFGPYRSNAFLAATKMGTKEIVELLRTRGCQLPE